MGPWTTAVMALGALSAAAAAATAQKTYRVGVDLVHFSVAVTDRQGEPVRRLGPEDFEIVEEGKPQVIQFFSTGPDGESELPLHLGFMLDTSGSMERDIREVRTAVIKFLNSMERAVDITLVDFDTEVRVARYGQSDFPRLIERIRNRPPGGWTAFYDALGMYLQGASEQLGQKVLIMYTDGVDTRSTMLLGDLMEILRASDVTIYALGYLEHQPSSTRHEQRMRLQRFAELTGGQAFFPSNLKEVDKFYEVIRTEISARYSLGYTSADTRKDGKWRDVKVRLTRPDLKGARVRTRAGYYAPMRAPHP
jgi:Ca-activated chloride channel family protein